MVERPQVVIVRKDKKIRHKLFHAAAFAATGGVSGIITAAEVANHASYNARTQQLQEGPRPTKNAQRAAELQYLMDWAAARKAVKKMEKNAARLESRKAWSAQR